MKLIWIKKRPSAKLYWRTKGSVSGLFIKTAIKCFFVDWNPLKYLFYSIFFVLVIEAATKIHDVYCKHFSTVITLREIQPGVRRTDIHTEEY